MLPDPILIIPLEHQLFLSLRKGFVDLDEEMLLVDVVLEAEGEALHTDPVGEVDDVLPPAVVVDHHELAQDSVLGCVLCSALLLHFLVIEA